MNGKQLLAMCLGVLVAVAFYLAFRFLQPKKRTALLGILIYISGWLAAHGIESRPLEKMILSNTEKPQPAHAERDLNIHIDINPYTDFTMPPPYQDHNDVPGPHSDQGHFDAPYGEGFHGDWHGDQGYPQHWDKPDYPGHSDTPGHDDVGSDPNHKDLSFNPPRT